MKNKNKGLWIGISIIVGIVLLILVGYFMMNNKPNVGDCADVTNYGSQHTTRYCKITGGIQYSSNGEYSFSLDGSSCKFYVYEYCTNGVNDLSNCHNGQWASLGGANTLNAKIVSKSLCS